MKKSALINFSVVIVAFIITATTLLMPDSGFAQGRGHGRGQVKKSAKFVNGHDARDGRWDGRGPKPRWVTNQGRNRVHPRNRPWWTRR